MRTDVKIVDLDKKNKLNVHRVIYVTVTPIKVSSAAAFAAVSSLACNYPRYPLALLYSRICDGS